MKQKGAFLVLQRRPTWKWRRLPDADMRERRRRDIENARRILLMAHDMGVKIASGFDPAWEGERGKNATEIVVLNKLGLSAIDSVRAATVNAAELLGWSEKVGFLEPGKYADLIVVSGDPLSDFTDLQRIKFVMKGGMVEQNISLFFSS